MTTRQLERVADLDAINLNDPRTFVEHDLSDLWRQIRTEDPVFWNRPSGGLPGFWAISRYHDNQAIYRDSKQFSTQRGNMLATLLHGGDSAGGRMISVTDGPRHKDLRGLILRAFSQHALEQVAARVRDFTLPGTHQHDLRAARRTRVRPRSPAVAQQARGQLRPRRYERRGRPDGAHGDRAVLRRPGRVAPPQTE
jgi:hypothetical protein